MPIYPDLAGLIALVESGTPMSELSPAEARESFRTLAVGFRKPEDVVPVGSVEDAVVPGAAGVQEAGYVGLGAAFGVPPEIALSVSLLRRAKDIGWGLPILGAWQWQEVRRL